VKYTFTSGASHAYLYWEKYRRVWSSQGCHHHLVSDVFDLPPRCLESAPSGWTRCLPGAIQLGATSRGVDSAAAPNRKFWASLGLRELPESNLGLLMY
jgi:hypothetical protein